MKESAYIVVFITAGSEEEAQLIASRLLEHRKAACVNIVASVESSFWWEGELDSAREKLLIVKSKASLLPEIVRLVKEMHSSEVPEIIALPVVGGNRDYLDWIGENVG